MQYLKAVDGSYVNVALVYKFSVEGSGSSWFIRTVNWQNQAVTLSNTYASQSAAQAGLDNLMDTLTDPTHTV